MNREQILALVKRVTEDNDRVPVGERVFYAAARITRRTLWKAGFPNYGAALNAAGYESNKLKIAYTDDELFAPLATLTRELGHFPTEAERFVARQNDATFPGPRSYKRRSTTGPLPQALLQWCRNNEPFQDVVETLERSLPGKDSPAARRNSRPNIRGYVYLMRYGNRGSDYKLGITENVARREIQLDMMSPTDVRIVHVIETDDPDGIEKYWQNRFASRRIKTKEVFRLTAEDVAAFKLRRFQ